MWWENGGNIPSKTRNMEEMNGNEWKWKYQTGRWRNMNTRGTSWKNMNNIRAWIEECRTHGEIRKSTMHGTWWIHLVFLDMRLKCWFSDLVSAQIAEFDINRFSLFSRPGNCNGIIWHHWFSTCFNNISVTSRGKWCLVKQGSWCGNILGQLKDVQRGTSPRKRIQTRVIVTDGVQHIRYTVI